MATSRIIQYIFRDRYYFSIPIYHNSVHPGVHKWLEENIDNFSFDRYNKHTDDTLCVGFDTEIDAMAFKLAWC